MVLDSPLFKNHLLQQIVPILIIIGLGYLDFACGYALGYKEIYRHDSKRIAVTLWCLLGISNFNTLLYWALVFIIGPGKAPSFPPLNIYNEPENDELIPLPDLFFCDESGYPYYCSHSKSIKIERSFFSKHVGYNVLKFDHYCIWIGYPLGQANYLVFIKYMFWFLSYFIIILVFTAMYTRASISRGEIDHNFIVLLFMSGFWIIMITTLSIAHYRYICFNMTTLDDLALGQSKRYNHWKSRGGVDSSVRPPTRIETGRRFVNVKKGDMRYIVEYNVQERPFDMGIKKNWMNLILNGNRNHGKSDDWYSYLRLRLAFFVLIVPYIDIPLCFRSRRDGTLKINDNEAVRSKPDELLRQYEYYSDVVNDKFREFINRKIDDGDCYPPRYLGKQETSVSSEDVQ
ncbi:PFA5 [[Candida] subhashii]|uniref:Palmitoyltransferase n=1 Tax=[Candida] subhashii TaxID=561895 RepID=A0A8J5Q8V9_9ASCO|nr:PFA5 [[Candida] subhashii]KAG7661536.1 PFA5 [[Candida] subhashii]